MKCPKCNKEITVLNIWETSGTEYDLDCDEWGDRLDIREYSIDCSECGSCLNGCDEIADIETKLYGGWQ